MIWRLVRPDQGFLGNGPFRLLEGRAIAVTTELVLLLLLSEGAVLLLLRAVQLMPVHGLTVEHGSKLSHADEFLNTRSKSDQPVLLRQDGPPVEENKSCRASS